MLDHVEDLPKKMLETVAAFSKEFEHENDLQVVLRGHIFIENELIKLLKVALVDAKLILDSRFGFIQKVKLAMALGMLPAEYEKTYKALSDIRNMYAHSLDYVFTKDDLNRLIQNLKNSPKLKKWYEDAVKYKEFSTDQEDITLQLRGIIGLLWVNLTLLVRIEEDRFIREELDLVERRFKLKVEEGISDEVLKEAYIKLQRVQQEMNWSDLDENFNPNDLKQARNRSDNVIPLLKELKVLLKVDAAF